MQGKEQEGIGQELKVMKQWQHRYIVIWCALELKLLL